MRRSWSSAPLRTRVLGNMQVRAADAVVVRFVRVCAHQKGFCPTECGLDATAALDADAANVKAGTLKGYHCTIVKHYSLHDD